jgi:outer membrane immunogenic protein
MSSKVSPNGVRTGRAASFRSRPRRRRPTRNYGSATPEHREDLPGNQLNRPFSNLEDLTVRHSLIGAVAACILVFAGVDVAAAAPATGDWTGLYVGGVAGVSFNQTRFSLPGDANDRLLQNSNNNTAFSGGGLIGFNYQMNDVVVGVEGDIITTGQSTAKVTDCTMPDGCFVNTHDSFTTYNRLRGGTTERARVRLGWAQGPNLFYVAGGYSAQQTKLDLLGDCFNPGNPNVPLVFAFSRSKTVSGFNIGGGVEHAIDRHWIGRVEYIYDGFGGQTYAGDGAEWNNRRLSISDNTVRAAIAYKF